MSLVSLLNLSTSSPTSPLAPPAASCKTYGRQKSRPFPTTRSTPAPGRLWGAIWVLSGSPPGPQPSAFENKYAVGSSVITACHPDLKPEVHQPCDLGLLLAAFVITACYADLKLRVRISVAAGNLRPQDLKTTGRQGRRHHPPALKRRGGMGAAL